jgi:hypothetical protein
MNEVIRKGLIMNVPIKAEYWVCPDKECGMELIKNYDKVRKEFIANFEHENIHLEDFIVHELNDQIYKMKQREKILGFEHKEDSPYFKAVKLHEETIKQFKEIHALVELNRVLLKNPKTLIPAKVKGYSLKDKLLLFFGIK